MGMEDDPLDRQSKGHWVNSVSKAFEHMSGRVYGRIRRRYGAESMGGLAAFFTNRYPPFEPDKLPGTMREFLGSLLELENEDVKAGTYERTALQHDRDPYDKGPGYDRAGFSRSGP